MVRHVFLTGEKQVGKSTLIKKFLRDYRGKLGGFFTVRTDTFLGDRYSVHLFEVGEEQKAAADNLLFVCTERSQADTVRFNTLGCRILEKSRDCSLLLMDELGRHEAQAAEFRTAVLQCIDREVPILGVLQAPAKDFWPEITEHPAVCVIEITENNREQDELHEVIRKVMKF